MGTILSCLKILGILMASYYSYLGLTKRLKNDDGSLTADGRKAKRGIIISCLISISAFFVDANLPKNNDDLNYPIADIEATGRRTAYINLKGQHDILLEALNETYDKWNSSNDPSLNRSSFIPMKNPLDQQQDLATLYFNKKGKPDFYWLNPVALENFFFFKHNLYTPLQPCSANIYITTDTDSSDFDGFFNKYSAKPIDSLFDIVYSPKQISIQSAFYYPAKKKIVFIENYNLKLISNSGKLKNLKDLSKCLALIASHKRLLLNSTQFTSIKTLNGLTLNNTELFEYRSKSALIPYPYTVSRYDLEIKQ